MTSSDTPTPREEEYNRRVVCDRRIDSEREEGKQSRVCINSLWVLMSHHTPSIVSAPSSDSESIVVGGSLRPAPYTISISLAFCFSRTDRR